MPQQSLTASIVKVFCPMSGQSAHGQWCYRERIASDVQLGDNGQYLRVFTNKGDAKSFTNRFRDCTILEH